MTVYESLTEKIQKMPEPMARELESFAGFLLWKQNKEAEEEDAYLTEAGMSDYACNLENYEDLLAQSAVNW